LEVGRPYLPGELAGALGVGTVSVREPSPTVGVVTVADLLESTEPEYEWLIPEFMERGDRLVVTGPEGYGKSTLLRQIGMGAALGEDTLRASLIPRRHDPRVVLLVDLENTPRQLRREFAKLVEPLGDEVGDALGRFHVVPRSDGVVLDVAKDPYGDRAWLEDLVGRFRPDLVLMGPIYKMLEGEPNDELPNRNVVKWLDRLRVDYDLAVILEAHTPHGERRPYGWSGWKRWPEFGFHLHDDGRLEHWRGQREERAWPKKLLREGGSQRWPWVPDLGNHPETSTDPVERSIDECRTAVVRCLRAASRPLTKNEIYERTGRRKASVLAAIARLADDAEIVADTANVKRADGKTYPVEGYRLSSSAPQITVVPTFPVPRGAELGNHCDSDDNGGRE
jgi:hypothetical protein